MTDEEFISRIRATPTLLSIMLQIDDALEARDKEIAEKSARIAELHKEVRIMDSEYKTAIARIAELEAENEKLREVLKPFANAANNFDSMPFKNAEEWFVYSGVLDASGYSGAISVADLRAARNGEK